MIIIFNILLIAISLSIDSFSLSLSYGMSGISKKSIITTSIVVGLFHFFMPLIGYLIGIPLFEYTLLKPKYILFFIFLIISIDMIICFFDQKQEIKTLNLLGIIIFAFSVSFDSLSVGLGISYLYDNIIIAVTTFCIVSMFFTYIGFILGKKVSNIIGKWSFLVGAITLFLYSILVLTKN